MRLELLNKSLYSALLVAFIGCATSQRTPMIVDLSEDTIAAPKQPPKPAKALKASERIGDVMTKSPDYNVFLQSAFYASQAEEYELESKYSKALPLWRLSLTNAEGRMANAVLIRLAKAIIEVEPLTSDQTAAYIIKFTAGGFGDAYLSTAGLDQPLKLKSFLEKNISTFKVSKVDPRDKLSMAIKGSAPSPGIPEDDRLLLKTARTYCASDAKSKVAWQQWEKTLVKVLRNYWRGLYLQCQGNMDESIRLLSEFGNSFAKSQMYKAHAIEATARAAIVMRNVGRRRDAAKIYVKLADTWLTTNVQPEDFDISPSQFQLRKINDVLWASRYAALVAEYEVAKKYASKSLNLIDELRVQSKKYNGKNFREELSSYRAEAYHVLSHRVATEQKHFDDALKFSDLALNDKELNAEWRQRMSWYAGIYAYLAGDYDTAQQRWLTLLAEEPEDSYRAKIYYWLARSEIQQGQKSEAQRYIDRLGLEFPTGYYYMVASKELASEQKLNWAFPFEKPVDLLETLQTRALNLPSSFTDDKTTYRLRMQAELLIEADVVNWATYPLSELNSKIDSNYKIESDPEVFIYLTRLMHGVKNFNQAIALSTKIMSAHRDFWRQWPEQLLIYFPRPYTTVYEDVKKSYNIDANLLYAISRQESGFRKDIKSPANAYGLMQLIIPTARRYAGKVGVSASTLSTALYEPEVNLAIAALYLRQLKTFYPQQNYAVFASYNAGENVVDMWAKSRHHPDPYMWVELIPFGETQSYTKNVWRNQYVYEVLSHEFGLSLSNL